MNDRALGVLEKYDVEVLRSWKGRSAILCETKTGIKILKEYKGGQERLLLQKKLLEKMKEKGFSKVEDIIPTKEGELIVKDEDMNSYYLKEYSSGKECNIKEVDDINAVAEQMVGGYMKGPALPRSPLCKLNHLPEIVDRGIVQTAHHRDLRMVLHAEHEGLVRALNGFDHFKP